MLLGLVWLVRYTRRGKAMRATAQDKDAAAMMGIDVNRTISFTFLVAGALAGAAGVIFAFDETTIAFYNTGFTLGLIAFTAAVLGGIGNLPGAVLGGLLIGFIQDYNEGLSWHAPGSAWTNTLVFGILILILVFRPQGLLGEQTPEGGYMVRAATWVRLQRRTPPRAGGAEERAHVVGEPPPFLQRAVPPLVIAATSIATRAGVGVSPDTGAIGLLAIMLRPLSPATPDPPLRPAAHDPRARDPLPASDPADELPALPLRHSGLQHVPDHRHDGASLPSLR